LGEKEKKKYKSSWGFVGGTLITNNREGERTFFCGTQTKELQPLGAVDGGKKEKVRGKC